MKTYDSSYVGWSSVERATLRSDNSVYAQLTLDVGPARVASLARRLASRTPLEVRGEFPPAMGARSQSPLGMASAYATLAAGGVYTRSPPRSARCLPNGKPDDRWAAAHRRTRVISDGVAHVVTRILEDNIRYRTGTRARSRPAAGKTGTTDKHADAWFVGYTPGLATAVWMGYRAGRSRWRTSTGSRSRADRSRRRSGGGSWSPRSPGVPSRVPGARQPV